MVASVPPDKVKAYAEQVGDLITRSSATQAEIKSVIGKLNWATSILVTGRGFLRRLIDSVPGKHNPQQLIPLDEETKKDTVYVENFSKILQLQSPSSFSTN